jgi:hypothetical protein
VSGGALTVRVCGGGVCASSIAGRVDGYPVLSIDEDTGDVVLDGELLREQFGLGAAT